MRSRPHLTAVGCLLMVVACAPAPELRECRFEAFASPIRIETSGGDPVLSAAACDALRREFAEYSRDWYAYGSGELARVNAALASGGEATPSPALRALIERAVAVSKASAGLFDPTVIDYMRLWGLDQPRGPDRQPPTPDAIAALAAARGSVADLAWRGDVLTSRRPLQLDLGGIAKGTAALRARDRLIAAGVRNALIDIGGSSQLVLGTRDGQRWRIGIRDPRSATLIGALAIAPGEAVASSGDYERYFETGGRRFSHVMDPRTGTPVTGVRAVTVITTDPELADAASTALMVAGPTELDVTATRLAVDAALLITDRGELRCTPAMCARLREANGGRLPTPVR